MDLPASDDYYSLWHDSQIAELQIVCRCGRDICSVSAYIGHRNAWEIALGRDLSHEEIRTGRSFGSDVDPNHRDALGQHHLRWTLVCPGRRCRFRRVVKYDRMGEAMVKAWYSGSARLVAGADL